MNRGIQRVLTEETQVNPNKSSDLWGILTCPLCCSLSPVWAALKTKSFASMVAMRTHSLLHLESRKQMWCSPNYHHQILLSFSLCEVSWNPPLAGFYFIWPDSETTFCKQAFPRTFVKNTQWQLFNIRASWGSRESWSKEETNQTC